MHEDLLEHPTKCLHLYKEYVIGVYHSSLSTLPQHAHQRARREKRFQTRQARRDDNIRRQRKKAEVNILWYMKNQLNVLYSVNLQMIILELATTPQVTHGINLRNSGAWSYLELMTLVVHDMIENGLIELHEDEYAAALALPHEFAHESVPNVIHVVQPRIDEEPDNDWSSLPIAVCKPAIRRILVEY